MEFSQFQNLPLILASKSPQRIRILEMMKIPFQAVESGIEEIINSALTPGQNAEKLAEQKAQKVFEKYPNSFVVGVDTIVVSPAGEILEKPQDRDDARKMFQARSGKTEQVISGICLISPKGKHVTHEVATIEFMDFSADDIESFLDLQEWEGKSGGIAVEGKSSVCIRAIHGNFWNIVGFPVPTFLNIWEEIMKKEKGKSKK